MAATAAHSPPIANGTVHDHAQQAQWNEKQPVATLKKRARPQKKKAGDENLIASLCTLICDHQIGIAVNLILLLSLTHIFFPRARRRTSKFLHLSYYNPETGLYGCGTDDLWFMSLWILIFTGARVAAMEYILDPLARLSGIKSKKGLVRFKEQAWLAVYYTCSWSLGMYIVYHSEFWLDLSGMWRGWPFREIAGLTKWYYLVQWASYTQQIIVVNIEEKRKDYAQMFIHHIFTSALIFMSYGHYHTRVGTAILCLMDLVDITLPTAKLLKYTGYTTSCDIAFGLFTLCWFVTRHIIYPMVCWSIYADTQIYIPSACYIPDGTIVPMSDTERFTALGGNNIWGNVIKAYTDRTGVVCWNPTVRYSFLAFLISLQAILLLWFAMIIRVVYKVVSGQGANDVRSDDESDDGMLDIEEEELGAAKASGEWGPPVEEEVGVEELNFTRKSSPANGVRSYTRQNRSGSGRASGISIPGHGDRKELLGRIGCDKPT